MSWSTTRADHCRYFAQFGRGDDPSTGRAATTPAELADELDEGTLAWIEQYDELWALGHSDVVVPLVERWQQLDRIGSASEKQEFLEPLIRRAQRAPCDARGELVMVLLALEPLRRSIAGRFMRSRATSAPDPTNRKERADARLWREIDRRAVIATTRTDTLRIVHSYPVGGVRPGGLFGWFREALSHRLVAELRATFSAGDSRFSRAEAEAVQAFLHGFELIDPPDLRHPRAFHVWVDMAGARACYAVMDDYFDQPRIRDVCRAALDRLPTRQRDALERYYYDRLSLEDIARHWGRAPSTARNTKVQAEAALRSDTSSLWRWPP